MKNKKRNTPESSINAKRIFKSEAILTEMKTWYSKASRKLLCPENKPKIPDSVPVSEMLSGPKQPHKDELRSEHGNDRKVLSNAVCK